MLCRLDLGFSRNEDLTYYVQWADRRRDNFGIWIVVRLIGYPK